MMRLRKKGRWKRRGRRGRNSRRSTVSMRMRKRKGTAKEEVEGDAG